MKTVLHINSGDTSKQSELLGNIQNLMDDETVDVDQISVVINSDAIDMVEHDSEASGFIEDFLENGVYFKACSNSLANRNISKKELIEGVEVVESGIGEINNLQDKDFNYIKI